MAGKHRVGSRSTSDLGGSAYHVGLVTLRRTFTQRTSDQESRVTTDRYIGVNADAGETFGRWRVGNDGELFCTSSRSKTRAATTPVTPGFPDRWPSPEGATGHPADAGVSTTGLPAHRPGRTAGGPTLSSGKLGATHRADPRGQGPGSARPTRRFARPLSPMPGAETGSTQAPQLVSREEPGRCRRPRPPGLERIHRPLRPGGPIGGSEADSRHDGVRGRHRRRPRGSDPGEKGLC
jgi:hypothetical protein